MPTKRLTEGTLFPSTVKVDREAGTITGVRIIGPRSKNRRRYSDRAVDEVTGFAEGITVNLDHPKDRKEAHRERGFLEGVAVLRGCKSNPCSDGRESFGTLEVFKKHPAAELLLERAEKDPQNFGLSINADGATADKRIEGDELVESVTKLYSVDVVSRPATNKGLFEDEEEQIMPKKIKGLLEEHRSNQEAARLVKLLEGDAGLAPLGTAEVEPPANASADQQVAAAMNGLVTQVLADSKLDAKAKAAAVAKVLGVEEKKPEEKPADKTGDLKLAESISTLSNQVAALTLGQKKTELLESAGLSRGSLSAAVRKQIDDAKDEAAVTSILESLTPAQRGGKKPNVGGKNFLESQNDVDESLGYEAMRDRIRGKAPAGAR